MSKKSGSIWHKVSVSTQFDLGEVLESLPDLAESMPTFKKGAPTTAAERKAFQSWLDESVAPLCQWPMSSDNLENDPPFGEECASFDGSDSLPDFTSSLAFDWPSGADHATVTASCSFRLPMTKRVTQAYLDNQFAEDHRPFAEACFFYVQTEDEDLIVEHNESEQFTVKIKPEGK